MPISAPPSLTRPSSSLPPAIFSPGSLPSTTTSKSPLTGLKIFKNHLHLIQQSLSEFDNSVVVANLYNLNVFSQSQFNELKSVSSHLERAVKLVFYLEGRLKESQKNFDLFVGVLINIPERNSLGRELSEGNYLYVIHDTLKQSSEEILNLTEFCNALNKHKLISDGVKSKALSREKPEDLLIVIFDEIKTKIFAKDFIDILRTFENTKSMSFLLESDIKDSNISKTVLPTLPHSVMESASYGDDSKDILGSVGSGSIDSGIKSASQTIALSDPDVESDKFVSAESYIRDKSMDVFHDSLTHSRTDLVDFRPRTDSTVSIGHDGVEKQAQESGSGCSTPRNHSARLVSLLFYLFVCLRVYAWMCVVSFYTLTVSFYRIGHHH